MIKSLPQCVRRSVSCGFYARICLLLLSLTAFGQEDFKPKLGTIDRASLEMTAYPGDSTAGAVYLYDYGNITFSYDDLKGLVMSSEMKVRIKILKESALDRASVSVQLYQGPSFKEQEWLVDLKGYTHNLENGQIITTALDRKSIKEEKSSDSYRTTRFNLPNVKKGSVIEYTYTLMSPMRVRPEPSTWTFQGSVPFQWSEYRITIPYYLDYKMMMGGYLPLYINQQEQVNLSLGHSKLNGPGISYRFVVKDAPAFVNEPYITTEADYLSKINFELASVAIPGEMVENYSKTWEHVERTLTEASWFGGELRKASFLKEPVAAIAAKTSDPTERMNLAYAFLQQTMKWDGFVGLRSGDGVKKAFDNKKGNASDINLMLTIMLRELGLDSNPVLLSTRSHGRLIEEVPLLDSFNYVIAHARIDDKEYLLDATQVYAKPGLLPEHALNVAGRLIPRKGQGRFVPITPIESKSKLEMINATIVPDEGIIKGNYSVSLGGYEALRWRGKYAEDAVEAIHQDLKKDVPEWDLQNIVIENKKETLGTVRVSCDFEAESDNATGIFYFNPILAGRWTTNPLKSKERIYPLDLTTGILNTFIGNYTLPQGYALEETPKAEILTLPDRAGKFAYQVRQVGNVIQVSSSINITKTRFSSEEYHDLKEFFERLVQRHSQPLVIKKQAN